ncbi:CaiB/BaiF CoA transferase family protein [Paraburkholderia sp. RL17-347-BIC-D]|uniref:CaiB/BaiF CoA transferase family protein n=1 Tax=Paraburkholderia sp. RL17-347-BIC-D TaxID=3031632 RepID=UPI0038BA274C
MKIEIGESSSGPCRGLRVLEFATMVSGPFAGQMLADLGAEVIKVEPTTGDPLRGVQPSRKGVAAGFAQFNRNKKSIGIDLKSSKGSALARELALASDVLIENFRPDVMQRLGLDYENLRKDNPRLIYVSISGFGVDGPYAARPAYDHVIQAMSGTMPAFGSKEQPAPIRNSIADKVTAITAANAVLAALVCRERQGGQGQKVSLSLLDSYSAFMLPDLMVDHFFQDGDGARETAPVPHTYYSVPVADGFVMGHIHTDAQFRGLCRLFEREDLLDDQRFADTKSRRTNYGAMWEEMKPTASEMPTALIVELAEKFSVPIGRVNDMGDFFDDPQVKHNRTYFDSEDLGLGTIRQLSYPVRFEKSPVGYRRRAPSLGEDTREILKEFGKTEEEVADAFKTNVVA